MLATPIPKKLARRCIRHLKYAEEDIFALIEDLQAVINDDTPFSTRDVARKLPGILECLAMLRDRLKDEERHFAELHHVEHE